MIIIKNEKILEYPTAEDAVALIEFIARYVESNELSPNHWIEDTRIEWCTDVTDRLSLDAKRTLYRLTEILEG